MLTLLATSLTACGGGGESGSSDSSSTPSSTTSPTPIPTSPTNSTVELAAMKLLNENRSQCGFGSLTANQNLNLTAMNHANYMASVTEINKQPFASHEEQAETGLLDTGITNPYYSGSNLTTRLNPLPWVKMPLVLITTIKGKVRIFRYQTSPLRIVVIR